MGQRDGAGEKTHRLIFCTDDFDLDIIVFAIITTIDGDVLEALRSPLRPSTCHGSTGRRCAQVAATLPKIHEIAEPILAR